MANQMLGKAMPKLIKSVRQPKWQQSKETNFVPQLMEHLCRRHKLLSYPTTCTPNVSSVGGERSYVMLGSLARLERALMRWTMDELVKKHSFRPIVVPNIIYDHIIENCGFPTKSNRSQVFKISGNNEESILDKKQSVTKTQSCLAGTSEFALASVNIGDVIPSEDLPKRYCAMSSCYRAETSKTSSEWGIFRVRYFNKVEMVALTMPDKSYEVHEEFLNIQQDLFNQLELDFDVLEMPEDDLGLSAKKKYDIEALMRGRNRVAEISSTSNCEDYQSSRLNIKYSQMQEKDDELDIQTGYVHTVNGTACSSVRTLITLIEQHQTTEGRVNIPKPLVPYMKGVTSIPTKEDEKLLAEVDLYPEDH